MENQKLPFHQWLAQHGDEQLYALLLDSTDNGTPEGFGEASRGHTVLESLNTFSTSRIDTLSALELAVLHSAYLCDAWTQGTEYSELIDTLNSLFAELEPAHPPTQPTVEAAVRILISQAFLYGPDVTLNAQEDLKPDTRLYLSMPLDDYYSPLKARFNWASTDYYLNDVPSQDLPHTIGELDSAQHKLVTTLARSGGVGHSKSALESSDTGLPLPTLIENNMVHHLGGESVRLNGRVSSALYRHLIGAPGGKFTAVSTPDTEYGATTPQGELPTHILDTLREIADILRTIGEEPLLPMNSGGIGNRELNHLAKTVELPLDQTLDLITLAIEAGLVATGLPTPPSMRGKGGVWSLTEQGEKYIAEGYARQWSMILAGWERSTYDSTQASLNLYPRPFDREISVSWMPDLRRHTVGVLSRMAREERYSTTLTELGEDLWEVQPGVAHSVAYDSFAQVLHEVQDLGILTLGEGEEFFPAPDENTPALNNLEVTIHPLAACLNGTEDRRGEAFTAYLPDPITYLIVQSDNTILAPGLLSADAQAHLQRMAVLESPGLATVWRISPGSLRAAYSAGETADSVREFLSSYSSDIPQGLGYTIDDTCRVFQENPTAATEASDAPEPMHVLRPDSEDEEFAQEQHNNAQGLLHSMVENFRKAQEDKSEGQILTDPAEIMQATRIAYTDNDHLTIKHVNAHGVPTQDLYSLVMLSPSQITAVSETTGDTVHLLPHRIASVTLME